MTRILLAAQAINPDGSSEGICTSKFLRALAHSGYDVHVLAGGLDNPEQCNNLSLSGVGDISIKNVSLLEINSPRAWLYRWLEYLRRKGKVTAYMSQKMDALVAYMTGYNAVEQYRTDRWCAAISDEISTFRPDIVITRGAGGCFEPHMAMLQQRSSVPWIAHYHDPYPSSLYPDPYRHVMPVISGKQEALHRQILDRADALTFPSGRLLRWVLRGRAEKYRVKGFVVPHIADSLPAAVEPPGDDTKPIEPVMTIVHTGTLLGPRDPTPLLDGFLRFANQSEHVSRRCRLILVGGVHPRHQQSGSWKRAIDSQLVHVVSSRVTYDKAVAIASTATALVVVEANSIESPFFPAKLADYLYLRKPIIAMSPKESVTADILGQCYPLLIGPQDSDGLAAALDSLYKAWEAGCVSKLVPNAEAVESISEGVAIQSLQQAMSLARGMHNGQP